MNTMRDDRPGRSHPVRRVIEQAIEGVITAGEAEKMILQGRPLPRRLDDLTSEELVAISN